MEQYGLINLAVNLAIQNATDLLNIGGHTNVCMLGIPGSPSENGFMEPKYYAFRR